MSIPWRRAAGAAACVLGLAAAARATDSKYQSYIVGDRAAGMGGAVVSLADSVDACYYNPAGLVRARASSVSLSANLYGFQRYQVDSGLYPGEDVRSGSFVTIPASMGGLLKATPRLSLAVAALVPDRELLSEIVAYQDSRHLYQYSIDSQTFWIGPSAAYRLTPACSVGLSLFTVYRSFNESVSVFYDDYDQAYGRARKFDDVALAAVLGLQFQPGGDWRVGLTAQSPTLHVYDQGKTTEHAAGGSIRGDNYYYTDEVETDSRQPAKLALGIGRMAPGVYACGLDLTYHLPTSYDLQTWQFAGELQRARVVRASVLDVNLGGEYYLRKRYPVRAGFFTGFSSVPASDDPDRYATSRVDTCGLTASVGRETETTAFNVGVTYVFGSGKDNGWEVKGDEIVRREVNASERHLYLTVNTAYYF